MSSAKVGLASAFGAFVGGLGGVYLGRYAATSRPRVRYAMQGQGDQIEDAMVVGGAAGAIVGAFVAGTLAGDEPPPALPPNGAQP